MPFADIPGLMPLLQFLLNHLVVFLEEDLQINESPQVRVVEIFLN